MLSGKFQVNMIKRLVSVIGIFFTLVGQITPFEPAHEIMALSILRKLILQTCMRGHPVGLDVWFLVSPFVYFHTLCVRTAKALVRLCRCAGSPEPSLVAYVISTIISWAGSFWIFYRQNFLGNPISREAICVILVWAIFILCSILTKEFKKL